MYSRIRIASRIAARRGLQSSARVVGVPRFATAGLGLTAATAAVILSTHVKSDETQVAQCLAEGELIQIICCAVNHYTPHT